MCARQPSPFAGQVVFIGGARSRAKVGALDGVPLTRCEVQGGLLVEESGTVCRRPGNETWDLSYQGPSGGEKQGVMLVCAR